ncbi:MAG: hypothetical protein ACLP59_17585 [Bryobacteraceae bacterium]
MKRIRTTLVAAVALLAVATCSSSADRRNFWLLNNTGRNITSFRVAVHGSSEAWGNDVLGEGTLVSAAGTVVYFLDYRTACVYDFRVGYADGTHQDYLLGRNLCTYHALQFNRATNDAY